MYAKGFRWNLLAECLRTCLYLRTKLQDIMSKEDYSCYSPLWVLLNWWKVYTLGRALSFDASRNATQYLAFSSARPRGRTGHCWRLWQRTGLSLVLNGRKAGRWCCCALCVLVIWTNGANCRHFSMSTRARGVDVTEMFQLEYLTGNHRTV
jgi:hypothetical protein